MLECFLHLISRSDHGFELVLTVAATVRLLLSVQGTKATPHFTRTTLFSSRLGLHAAGPARRPETDSGAVHRVAAQLRRGAAGAAA